MKSLVTYYGGKIRIASKILPLFPEHKIYVEPFAGGAALLFAKPAPEYKNASGCRECLNDINDQVITLYRVAREKPEELAYRLKLTPYSQSDHRLARDILKGEAANDIETAWAVVVRCRQSFAKSMFNGWGTSRKGCDSSATWFNFLKEIDPILERLQKVHLSSEDAIRCIERWDDKDGSSFFYIDPPYPSTNQGHYKGYTQSDFEKLIDCLKGIKGKFILSNYPNVAVPAEWRKIEIPATMSASKNKDVDKKRTEVLWMNFDESQKSLF